MHPDTRADMTFNERKRYRNAHGIPLDAPVFSHKPGKIQPKGRTRGSIAMSPDHWRKFDQLRTAVNVPRGEYMEKIIDKICEAKARNQPQHESISNNPGR